MSNHCRHAWPYVRSITNCVGRIMRAVKPVLAQLDWFYMYLDSTCDLKRVMSHTRPSPCLLNNGRGYVRPHTCTVAVIPLLFRLNVNVNGKWVLNERCTNDDCLMDGQTCPHVCRSVCRQSQSVSCYERPLSLSSMMGTRKQARVGQASLVRRCLGDGKLTLDCNTGELPCNFLREPR